MDSLIGSSLSSLSKKQEKQIILRKLQYDIVKCYSNWYCLIWVVKFASLGGYIYASNLLSSAPSLAQKQSSLLSVFTSLEGPGQFLAHLSGILVVGLILELANYYLIYRWRQNIKRDIIESLFLERE